MQLYHSMRTSLGIVAVSKMDSSFEYQTYKAMDPDQEDISYFVDGEYDNTDLFIIHGRLATHGERNLESAHPIGIDCDECSVDYVLHNGVISTHDRIRRKTEQNGHEYTTDVDSEVIAHKHGGVPEEIGKLSQQIAMQPCYILLNDERIYIHTSWGYKLERDGELARNHRQFGPTSGEYRAVILTAGGDN